MLLYCLGTKKFLKTYGSTNLWSSVDLMEIVEI